GKGVAELIVRAWVSEIGVVPEVTGARDANAIEDVSGQRQRNECKCYGEVAGVSVLEPDEPHTDVVAGASQRTGSGYQDVGRDHARYTVDRVEIRDQIRSPCAAENHHRGRERRNQRSGKNQPD